MPRRASNFELALPFTNGEPAKWRRLCESLRQGILTGHLRAATRLPATRDLAQQYGVARGTVFSAFEQLKAEGYLEGKLGSGTYVSRTLPESWLEVVSCGEAVEKGTPKNRASLSRYGQRVKFLPNFESRPTKAFRPNLPALDLFPIELWAQVAGRVLRRAPTRALMSCDTAGYLPLREAIADYLNTSRGVRCSAQQVVIVSGTQEALDITARILLDPGDKVCMEDPGYDGAAMLFAAHGARVSGIPVDEEGMMVRRLPQARVRLVFVTPGHQYPLGVTMSLSRRGALLEWASKSGALIFEDDYDSEYRYAGRPIPALQGLDRKGVVLYAGTFSKTLFPALRLGYMVVPESLVDRVEAAKSLTNRHAPVLDQAVLHAFITQGHFARHIRRMRTVYAERLSVLLEEARTKLKGLLTITGVEAGLQTAAWLPAGVKDEVAAAAAARLGIHVNPISRYAMHKLAVEGLHLGFAPITPREIRQGVRNLARALESLSSYAKNE